MLVDWNKLYPISLSITKAVTQISSKVENKGQKTSELQWYSLRHIKLRARGASLLRLCMFEYSFVLFQSIYKGKSDNDLQFNHCEVVFGYCFVSMVFQTHPREESGGWAWAQLIVKHFHIKQTKSGGEPLKNIWTRFLIAFDFNTFFNKQNSRGTHFLHWKQIFWSKLKYSKCFQHPIREENCL